MALSSTADMQSGKHGAGELVPEIVNRFSCRRFSDHAVPLPKEQVTLLLEAARSAPSGCNRQPWRFVVVQDRGHIDTLSAFALPYQQHVVQSSSCVIVALGDPYARGPEQTRDRWQELRDCGAFTDEPCPSSPEPMEVSKDKVVRDCSIAVYALMLQATRLGLATCWITIADKKGLYQSCLIPPEFALVAMVAIGRPEHVPPPRPRKSIGELAYSEAFGTNWCCMQ